MKKTFDKDEFLKELMDEYQSLATRHKKVLTMIDEMLPLMAELEDSKEKRKLCKILTLTAIELLDELREHKGMLEEEDEEESED